MGLVEVDDLQKSFGVPVIDHLSLSVDAGEAVGIVGPNGAGKTTLLSLIAGELEPDHGTISFQGRDITHARPDLRAKSGIARTAQIPRPFEGLSVFENVLVGATFGTTAHRREATDRAVAALEDAGMIGKANVPAGRLPLLDRKRLELARALATRPKLLLLDEIAVGLTEGEVHELIDRIREIHANGVTIVWIEHIVHALLAVVTRMMAMSFGRKIAEGEPRDVMSSAAVREVYLGVGEA